MRSLTTKNHSIADVARRVQAVQRMLSEDADTFGKRAELMYARRPDILKQVRPLRPTASI